MYLRSTSARRWLVLSVGVSLLALSACGGDSDSDSGAPNVAEITFACPGGDTIADGRNQLTVNGRTRSFHADFPADESRPMGVIFSWHGFGDSLENHRNIVGLDPDGDPQLPVIVITPDDIGILPPRGLDWDIRSNEDNVDLAFFEAMLGCLNEQHDIDAARVYSLGFSAGSVMTALLHSTYPELLSAVICVSGAWFNDQAQIDLVNVFNVSWSWPELDAADGGAVLLTHGGPTDVTVLDVLDLEQSAQAALPFLGANGRVVVDCPHDQGHVLHPGVTPAVISKFISAHRAGEASSYSRGGFRAADFPVGCTLRLP